MILTFLLVTGLQQPALGTVRFPVSCAPAAQRQFNRAVASLHSFAFGPATNGFQAVLRADSTCTIAWWGIALSAWGNPFAADNKAAAQIARGLEAVLQGRRTTGGTERERGYLEAVARLYEKSDSLKQPARLAAYRDAMKALAAREPADTEAAIFSALAQAVAADPADKSYTAQLAAGAVLERLFQALPDHPGLAHYLIHAYDVPPLARRATVAAHRYGQIAPAFSHALHMPSHTYTRVGSWNESIAANRAAATAARRERSTAEELHALDYQVYAYLQQRRYETARRLVAGLPAIEKRFDPTAITTGAPPSAGYFALAAIPARYALERGAWAEAARLTPPASPFGFADAIGWFARGLGGARSGDTATARVAIAELARLSERLGGSGEAYWREQVEIQRLGATAWLELAQGDTSAALVTMEQAAQREDATEKHAITAGPLAPARELLGEMLLQLGRPEAALAAFQATLLKEPHRRRALEGVARAKQSLKNVPS